MVTAHSKNQGERTRLRASEVSFATFCLPTPKGRGRQDKGGRSGAGPGSFPGEMEDRGAKQLELWEEVVGGGKGIFFFFLDFFFLFGRAE